MTRTSTLVLAVVLAACRPASPPPAPVPGMATPEITGGPEMAALGKRGEAVRGMVASAHPLASEAGVEMLRRGGNAVDAAVAAAFAVGVVEPMMAGIGGSGGMLIWWHPERRAEYLDFYSRAPAGAAGREPPVGIPGAVAGLLAAHERFGALERQVVLEPAIRLAAEGFPVSVLLARTIAEDSAKLAQVRRAREIFWPRQRPLAPGELLVQPELAATLRRIAAYGRAGFDQGPVADEVVRVLREHGSAMTVEGLAGFTPLWKRPLCGEYRGRVVLSAPPPQSGVQIILGLHLLEPYDLAALGDPTRSADAFTVLAGALRTAAADRIAWNADPEYVEVPAAGLATGGYARQRAAAMPRPGVSSGSVPDRVAPGDPRDWDGMPASPGCARHEPYGPGGYEGRVIRDRSPWLAGEGAASRIAPGLAVSFDLPVAKGGGEATRLRVPGRGESADAWLADGGSETSNVWMVDRGGDAAERSVGYAGRETLRLSVVESGGGAGDLPVVDAVGETTHLSVVDDAGNAVSLTYTQGVYFGSGLWAAGTFLNSAMEIFSADPSSRTALVPGAAPPSTTTPTIVLEDGRVRLVVGSPGGGRIPPATIQAMVYSLDYGLDPLEALRMPRMYPFPTSREVAVEQGFRAEALAGARQRGFAPRPMPPFSLYFGGVHLIEWRGGRWVGAADPRRDGEVRGH